MRFPSGKKKIRTTVRSAVAQSRERPTDTITKETKAAALGCFQLSPSKMRAECPQWQRRRSPSISVVLPVTAAAERSLPLLFRVPVTSHFAATFAGDSPPPPAHPPGGSSPLPPLEVR